MIVMVDLFVEKELADECGCSVVLHEVLCLLGTAQHKQPSYQTLYCCDDDDARIGEQVTEGEGQGSKEEFGVGNQLLFPTGPVHSIE